MHTMFEMAYQKLSNRNMKLQKEFLKEFSLEVENIKAIESKKGGFPYIIKIAENA